MPGFCVYMFGFRPFPVPAAEVERGMSCNTLSEGSNSKLVLSDQLNFTFSSRSDRLLLYGSCHGRHCFFFSKSSLVRLSLPSYWPRRWLKKARSQWRLPRPQPLPLRSALSPYLMPMDCPSSQLKASLCLENLPVDILIHIQNHLDGRDIIVLRKVYTLVFYLPD